MTNGYRSQVNNFKLCAFPFDLSTESLEADPTHLFILVAVHTIGAVGFVLIFVAMTVLDQKMGENYATQGVFLARWSYSEERWKIFRDHFPGKILTWVLLFCLPSITLAYWIWFAIYVVCIVPSHRIY